MIKLKVLRLEHHPGPYMQSQISLERQRRHHTQRRWNREEFRDVGLEDRNDVAISQGVPVATSQWVPMPPEAGIGKERNLSWSLWRECSPAKVLISDQ